MLKLYCSTCKKIMQVEPVAGATDSHLADCPVCGAALAGQRYIAPHTRISRYEVISEIGRGGMGVVYLAHQLDLDRDVALKVLSDEMASDEHFYEAFFNEARAAAALNHPNIVQAIESGKAPLGINYFVMELIEGENLDVYVRENGAMELGMALKCAAQMADALNYAWDFKRLAHRDIKPENIIYLPKTGEFKLADLGLAKDFRDATATDRNDEIMATPAYAPPEVIRGETIQEAFKSDMYSFGASLYHIITGNPPFSGKTPDEICDKQLNEQPKPLIGINHAIPSKLSILVDRLMEKAPEKRPASWQAVLDELNNIIESFVAKREEQQGAEFQSVSSEEETTAPQNKYFLYGTLAFAILFFLFSAGTLLYVLFFQKPTGETKPQQQVSQPIEETVTTEDQNSASDVVQPQMEPQTVTDTTETQEQPQQQPAVEPPAPQVVEIDPWDKLKEDIKPLEKDGGMENTYKIWQKLQAYHTLVGDRVNPEYYTLFLKIQNGEYKAFCEQQRKDMEYIRSATEAEKLEEMNEADLMKLQKFIRNFVKTAYHYADWTPSQCPERTLREYDNLAEKVIQAQINVLRKERKLKAQREAEMLKQKPLEFKAVADVAMHGSTAEFDRAAKAWTEKFQQYVTEEDKTKLAILRAFSQNVQESLFDILVKAFQRDVFRGRIPFPTVLKTATIRGVSADGKELRMQYKVNENLRRTLKLDADDWMGKDKELLQDFIFKSKLFPLLFLPEQKKLLHHAAAQGFTTGELKQYVENNLNISSAEFKEMFGTLDEMRRLGILL